MLEKRPWVKGKIIETKQYSEDDGRGIDMFVPVDSRLTDLLCMDQDVAGVKVQVKSGIRAEYKFWEKYKKNIFDLAKGDSIFVLNGQDDYRLMMASLLGQLVSMSSLTGSIPEEVLLGFLAEDLNDQEAVLAYIENRDLLIRDRWFKEWLDGSKIE